MGKTEPKKILPEAEMKAKVEEAIDVYKKSDGSVRNLYLLVDVLIDVHNEACHPGREMTWMTTFQASYPDH